MRNVLKFLYSELWLGKNIFVFINCYLSRIPEEARITSYIEKKSMFQMEIGVVKVT